MKNYQFILHFKRLKKPIIPIMLILLLLIMCSCTSNNDNEPPVAQYFTDSCPIDANGTFDDNKMTIELNNKSNSTITGWAGAILYYDSTGNPIKGYQGNLLFGIKENDTIYINQKSTWEYAFGVQTFVQARLYIYYVSFNNQKTWGKENLSEDETIQYGEKFSIQRDLSQYYSGQCGLVDSEGDSEKSQIVSGYAMVLNLKNNSTQSIIAYEAIVIQYNVYGDKLKGSSDSSVYKTIKCQPVGFEPNKSDFNSYPYYSNTSYAEVYVYYVLFADRTSWGYRENTTPSQALKYGTKFILYRTT